MPHSCNTGQESRVMFRQAVETMLQTIPEWKSTVIPEAVHPVHTDNPAGFQRAVHDFLKESTAIVP